MTQMTTSGNVPAAVNNYYDKVLLERAKQELIFSIPAQKRNIPANSSDYMKFRRYSNLATATTPLTEGVTPTGKVASVTDIRVQLKQYGDFITVTDKIQYIIEDSILNENADVLGQQMGETRDELVRDVLNSTASVYNCTKGSNGGTPTEITASDIAIVVARLRSNDAKMFTPDIGGSTNFGTSPLEKAFWVLGHTDLIPDLRDVTGFTPVAGYGQKVAIQGEECSIGNSRWLLTSAGIEASGTYSSIMCGKNAYAISELAEGVSSMIFQEPTDPLKQRSTQGWKDFFAAVLLNENWLCKINSTLASA